MMTPTWLLCSTVILLALSVSARPAHYAGPSYLEYPSLQAFAPRRFIKISKRRQYPILTEFPYLDLINLSAPPPSPFHSSHGLEEDQAFSRAQRNDEADSRAAEDYYNDWIMSNVG